VGRRLSVVLVAVALVVLAPTAAGAHVTVNPDEASAGGFATLTFQVPNERDVPTTGLEVTLPVDTPIPFVSVQPGPGWTYEVQRATLDQPIEGEGEEITEVVERISWSGGEVLPGEFQTFSISAGPLPEDAETLLFPAVQTYADGEPVRWVEPPSADGSEPEFPAPALTLTPATGDEHGGEGQETTSTTATGSDEESAASDDVASSDDLDTAMAIAIAGVIAGLAGVGVGFFALARSRRARS
jgi:uncharacterized protein